MIGSDNGLSPGRRQAIIWTNAGVLLMQTLGTNFSEMLNEILTFLLKKMHLKMSSAKWCLFRLGLNELNLGTVDAWGLLDITYGVLQHSWLHCLCEGTWSISWQI